jgi:hypothetical protein
MEPGFTRDYSRRRKVLISVFILFHFACVIAWILPKPSPVKAWLLGLKLPLPGTTKVAGGNGSHMTIASREVVACYLHNTAQWQDWAMFAPNPVQTNQYLGAHVIFERGNWREYTLPRLEEMNWFEAWAQKRYRKLKNRLLDEKRLEYDADLARWIARQMNEPGNPPIRVTLYSYESPIPRHDRKELQDPKGSSWVDYSQLLREKAAYSPTLLVDYFVQPGDLK